MYFPYLRGKQYELLALREESIFLSNKKNIIPIIEPVKEKTTDLLRAVSILEKSMASYVLIVNPQVGELSNRVLNVSNEFKLSPDSNAFLGFVINYETTLKNITDFLATYQNYKVCFIHFSNFQDVESLKNLFAKSQSIQFQIFIDGAVSQKYQNQFNQYDRVLIKDCFRKAKKNFDYKKREDELFTDAHLSYESLGYRGFGDFTVVGNEYESSGGPAYSVAIHYTYLTEPTSKCEVKIRHFVSDKLPDSNVDTAGKFREALAKLFQFIEQNPQFNLCGSCKEFQNLHRTGDFPQLGPVKKLSIKHHLHLMGELV